MRTTPIAPPSPILEALAQFLGILKRSCSAEAAAEATQLERWIARFYEGREGQTEASEAASAAEKEVSK